jgi:hypothetical protein
MQASDIDPTGVKWEKHTYREVWEQLSGYRRGGQTLVVGVDGHSGSGKTTLARGLAALDSGIAVLHTDDLAWHHSLFDWGQQLIDHVLAPLRRGDVPIVYRPPAWVERDRPGAISISAVAAARSCSTSASCSTPARVSWPRSSPPSTAKSSPTRSVKSAAARRSSNSPAASRTY